jgi:Reverse transcriptase (RNA-dependent DNA polymerase)
MEIPLGFGTTHRAKTVSKVCRLKKSLYGLKQSPRAWFDRFRKVMINLSYQQINADHSIFSTTQWSCSLCWLYMSTI